MLYRSVGELMVLISIDPKAKSTDLGSAAGMPKIEIERVTTTQDTGAAAMA
jgi:hypothetical protein